MGLFYFQLVTYSSTLGFRDFVSAISSLQNSSNNLKQGFLRHPFYMRFLKTKTNPYIKLVDLFFVIVFCFFNLLLLEFCSG